jgi:lipopolysaccharide heptosyltransferase I
MGAPPGRILLVKPSALGDVLRSMPVAASLKAAFPGAELDWLVQDDFADAVRAHPAVSRVITFPRRAWRAWWSPAVLADIRGFMSQLRGAGYGLAIDVQGLFRSGFFLRGTAAARRVGWSDAREFAWLGATERHARRGGPDATEIMLALLEDAGIPPVRDARVHVPPTAVEAWRRRATRHGLAEGFILLAPTSRWAAKRWPASRWRDLAASLLAEGHRVAMVGAPSERAQVAAAMPQGSAVNLCGELPLAEWLAAIAQATAVVANDSAAVHAAAGLGRPLVGLYASTDPAAVGPYGRPESVEAAPGPPPSDPHAYRDDLMQSRMQGIGVDAVRTRLRIELDRGPRW